jgi:hypothetical protein
LPAIRRHEPDLVLAAAIGARETHPRTIAEELNKRLEEDPFVVHGVVSPEVVGLQTTMSDPRLAFLA